MTHAGMAASQSEPGSGAEAAPKLVSIDTVVARINEVSTLPHIALKVMEVANDPSAGAADLRVIVESDPALSSRLLKCVNSAAYGLRNRVTSLQRAIGYLGFKQVRNLAVTASVSDTFKKDASYGTYSRPGLWKHMVSVAVCSRLIATRRKLSSFEEAFLAGLLHDIGIVLEDQYCQPQFADAMQQVAKGRTLPQVETQLLGFDHCRLGARIAESWKFPSVAIDAIRYHHMPQNYRGDDGEILACVDLANLVCTLKGVTSVGQNLLRPSRWSLDKLGVDKAFLKVLAEDLDHELELSKQLFSL